VNPHQTVAHGLATRTKHGRPDLGTTPVPQAWEDLGVHGRGIADDAPAPGHPIGQLPRLTIVIVARLQGLPDSWAFCGLKTVAWRQVGNAFPPADAAALGIPITTTLSQALHRQPPEPGQAITHDFADSGTDGNFRQDVLQRPTGHREAG
jgi:site-specific DNA-cytosine methylase